MSANRSDEDNGSADSTVLQGTNEEAPPEVVVATVTWNLRWAGLASVCMAMMANYYSIDIPAVLHQDLKDYMDGSSSNNDNFELRFNLLYTVYSLPNVVLPLIGGIVVDLWGASFSMVGYSACLWLGQVLFATGLSRQSWTVMLLGRAVYGLGGEAVWVANSALLTDWFPSTERSFAFGSLTAICRLGSVLNTLISPKVAHSFGTPWALWLGVVLQTMGLAAAFSVQNLDSGHLRAPSTRTIESSGTTDLLQPLLLNGEQIEDPCDEGQTSPITEDPAIGESSGRPRILDVWNLGPIFWVVCTCCMVVYGCINPFNNVASGILLERNYFKTPPADCQLKFPRKCTAGRLALEPNPSFDAHGNTCPGPNFAPVLPTPLPINSSRDSYHEELAGLRNDAFVDCDQPFWSQDCTQNYCTALHDATERAGRILSIPYAVSGILSPLIGKLVDRVDRRAILSLGAALCFLLVHVTLAAAPADAIPVWILVLGQGASYAVFAAVIWPSVGMVVDQRMTGIAYGIILSMQNASLALFPILVAAIYRRSQRRYIPNVELLFVACAAVGSLVASLLWILDQRNGNKLNQVASVQS